MTDKEFKKLSRSDLLGIIYKLQLREKELTEANEALAGENARLKEQARYLGAGEATITVRDQGSIAEAVLSVSGILQAAQETADKYVQEVRKEYEEIENINSVVRQKAEAEAKVMLDTTKAECEAMRIKAEAEINAKWTTFSENVQKVLEAHQELNKLLGKNI